MLPDFDESRSNREDKTWVHPEELKQMEKHKYSNAVDQGKWDYHLRWNLRVPPEVANDLNARRSKLAAQERKRRRMRKKSEDHIPVSNLWDHDEHWRIHGESTEEL